MYTYFSRYIWFETFQFYEFSSIWSFYHNDFKFVHFNLIIVIINLLSYLAICLYHILYQSLWLELYLCIICIVFLLNIFFHIRVWITVQAVPYLHHDTVCKRSQYDSHHQIYEVRKTNTMHKLECAAEIGL